MILAQRLRKDGGFISQIMGEEATSGGIKVGQPWKGVQPAQDH